MSYAIETKKRKFDRILEDLVNRPTSSAGSPPRTAVPARNNASTTLLSHDTASDLSKRRRITPTSTPASSISCTTSDLSGHYLPSSRPAFLQRLETFRHVTRWHIPSTSPINAAAWAKRGWICVETDTVACGACKERFHVDLSVDDALLRSNGEELPESGTTSTDRSEEDDFDMSTEVYDSIVKRYENMILTAHTESCLWRKRGSDASIQRIEGLLNTNSTLSGLRSRYDSLMTRSDEIPQVESLPSSTLVEPEELQQFQANTEEKTNINALTLAICGWERKSEDVLECHHCYRSLGLWLYRGETPAIEKLEAIESHLEYCPWRSAEAQDTEIQMSHDTTTDRDVSRKGRVSGWVLVYQVITKNNKQRRPRPPSSVARSDLGSSAGSNVSQTSEQRERKMRDLLRRIKEIKKPFNVKGLLRRKDKSKT